MSGAGKSTLLRCLSMLERPTSRPHLLDGVDLAACGASELIAPTADGRGLSGLSPADAEIGAAERRFSAAAGGRPRRRADARVDDCSNWWGWRTRRTPIRRSSRAGSASGWPSPGRWPPPAGAALRRAHQRPGPLTTGRCCGCCGRSTASWGSPSSSSPTRSGGAGHLQQGGGHRRGPSPRAGAPTRSSTAAEITRLLLGMEEGRNMLETIGLKDGAAEGLSTL